MAPVPLSSWTTLRRRYSRSVNLERDLDVSGSVRGYVLTPRASDALERIVEACITPKTSRAFTLTGVYGTGKSAFAHFLTALLASSDDPMRADARAAVKADPSGRTLAKLLHDGVDARGFVRAVATAQREPLADTVLRALQHGAQRVFAHRPGRRSHAAQRVLRELSTLSKQREAGRSVDSRRIPGLVAALADIAGTGLLLVIDELGKVLEFTASEHESADVYLLQQLAEAPLSPEGHPLVLVGLLHQSFADYGAGLAAAERTEWQKVQGRFEDIAFADAPEHMVALMTHAISHDGASTDGLAAFRQLGTTWHSYLTREALEGYVSGVLSPDVIAAVAPLHPVAALVLPALCTKYAQHDRSLYTFLTSSEPHSFARFLRERTATPNAVPMQKVADLYDYFIDVAGFGLASRPQFQRWAEVHGVVNDSRPLGPDVHAVLKTIGTLNLVASAGPLRASRAIVLAALLDRPDHVAAYERWSNVLDDLTVRGVITYRRQLDEYRVWEGSDFDIDAAVLNYAHADARPLVAVLAEVAPLEPMIAQRHSFETGTLRYFERRYADPSTDLSGVRASHPETDGLVLYWLAEQPPADIPSSTADGRPLVIVAGTRLGPLRTAAGHFVAVRSVVRGSVQLQSDAVARREMTARLAYAERDLERAVRQAFDLTGCRCWVEGREEHMSDAAFNAHLSVLCARAYDRGIVLWNELVNKRELTSQGARARRELIDAMLRRGREPRLGIAGNGPEASLYESVLRDTGMHREEAGRWTFGRPITDGARNRSPAQNRLEPLWDAVESFCLDARAEARTLDELLVDLQAPPYGVKLGVVPIVLAAVLLHHADDVSVYQEGSFLPILGPEHFELLVKRPASFSVKHFELAGVRWQVFHELEGVVRQAGSSRNKQDTRNATLLSVVRPLVQFATALPRYTRGTASLSSAASGVRDALLSAREPDELLFRILPLACGLPAFEIFAGESEHGSDPARGTTDLDHIERAAMLRHALLVALRELASAYERQLERCTRLMHAAFGVADNPTRLREHLSVRAQYLVEGVLEPTLRRFLYAAVNDTPASQDWLEGVLMVVADKPVDAWTDDDALAFELHLSDLARRFSHLEGLRHEVATVRYAGFDARRITITRTDGREQHYLVWIDPETRHALDVIVRDVRAHVAAFTDEQRRAVAAAIAEALLESDSPANLPRVGNATLRQETVGRDLAGGEHYGA